MDLDGIIASIEVRRHNGQRAYGEWEPLREAPFEVREEVVCCVFEMSEDAGTVEVGGQKWVFRRIDLESTP